MKNLTHTQELKAALENAPEEFQAIIKELFKMRQSQRKLKQIINDNK
jgi:hypothetical protein